MTSRRCYPELAGRETRDMPACRYLLLMTYVLSCHRQRKRCQTQPQERTRIMRLLIDTKGVQFRVAGAAKPRPDYKDRDRQAKTRDGQPVWIVRLDAVDAERETKETIWV